MAEPWSPIGIEVTSLLLKKRYNFVDGLRRDRLLFEDALECILETLQSESVEDDIDSLGESLEVTAMEVRRNSIEIRVCSENYQVAGIRPPTAMEFHREQQLSFRNPRRTAGVLWLAGKMDGTGCRSVVIPFRRPDRRPRIRRRTRPPARTS